MNYKVNNKEGGILEALKQAYDEHIDFIKSRKKKAYSTIGDGLISKAKKAEWDSASIQVEFKEFSTVWVIDGLKEEVCHFGQDRECLHAYYWNEIITNIELQTNFNSGSLDSELDIFEALFLTIGFNASADVLDKLKKMYNNRAMSQTSYLILEIIIKSVEFRKIFKKYNNNEAIKTNDILAWAVDNGLLVKEGADDEKITTTIDNNQEKIVSKKQKQEIITKAAKAILEQHKGNDCVNKSWLAKKLADIPEQDQFNKKITEGTIYRSYLKDFERLKVL